MTLKLTLNWLALMVLTLGAFFIGESGEQLDLSLLLAILALGIFKSQLLVDHFMGLHKVAGPWRLLLSLYAIIIFSIIAFIFSL